VREARGEGAADVGLGAPSVAKEATTATRRDLEAAVTESVAPASQVSSLRFLPQRARHRLLHHRIIVKTKSNYTCDHGNFCTFCHITSVCM
jgi:hypothetical protein